MPGDMQRRRKWRNSEDDIILAGKCIPTPTATNIIIRTKRTTTCKRTTNYFLTIVFYRMESERSLTLYQRRRVVIEEYKPGSSLVEYGLKPFNPDGTETNESDLVRQKKMDNKFGGGVFSLNYTGNRLTASLGGGLNQYRGNNFGKVTWVKNYIGNLSPEHEYYRNKSKKTDGNIYLKANYDLTSTLSAYADLQYRHIDYTIDGVNDKYDWNKKRPAPASRR